MAEAGPILVVEDDADCRTVLADLLESAGYPVTPCGEAPEALEAARRAPPALVVVDLNLPGRDGAWLVRELRGAGKPLSTVPVLLTTGSVDARSIAESLGVRSLEKPFDADRLFELVGSLLRRDPP